MTTEQKTQVDEKAQADATAAAQAAAEKAAEAAAEKAAKKATEKSVRYAAYDLAHQRFIGAVCETKTAAKEQLTKRHLSGDRYEIRAV